ncbi:MAG: GreA/GreB family elongation factor [Alphaproteobacteria bacterium]|nr:GreA/GreB family elongation factor [Alphaproteobacteria bacterium]
MITKRAVYDALLAALKAQEADLVRSQRDATASMRVDGDHRPTNRGERGAVTSAGYLTAGIEQRLTEVRDALDLLERTGDGPRDKAVTGALVTVEDDDGTERCFYLFPGAPGVEAAGATVVSPDSPVGRALWGLEVDDGCEIPGGAVVVASIA